MEQKTSSQSGSVIFWIFIAIALFAALSFTVSRITRTGGTEMSERARLQAAAIMQYAGAVQQGVKLMRINGVDESELCFHNTLWGHTDYEYTPQCDTNENRLFHPQGGDISFQRTDADWYDLAGAVPAADSGNWVFSGYFEVEDIGTDSNTADTVADNADVIMATAPIKDDVCAQINLLLGYSPGTPPALGNPIYSFLAADEYVGTFAGHTDKRLEAYGRERCVTDPTGTDYNMYYKVILAR